MYLDNLTVESGTSGFSHDSVMQTISGLLTSTTACSSSIAFRRDRTFVERTDGIRRLHDVKLQGRGGSSSGDGMPVVWRGRLTDNFKPPRLERYRFRIPRSPRRPIKLGQGFAALSWSTQLLVAMSNSDLVIDDQIQDAHRARTWRHKTVDQPTSKTGFCQYSIRGPPWAL